MILKSALVLAIEPVGAAQQTANYVIDSKMQVQSDLSLGQVRSGLGEA